MSLRTLSFILVGALAIALGSGCVGADAPAVSACDVDEDCQEGSVCNDGLCGENLNPIPPDRMRDTGQSCDEGRDCLSGQCVQLEDGRRICTEFCGDGTCPEGFVCTLLENSGADAVFLCFPEVDFLCRPCAVDANCGGFSDRCLRYDNGSFCGVDCRADDCPEGYDCVQQSMGEEEIVFQCMIENRFCCTISNGGVEVCDMLDNDCNGRTDDLGENDDVNNCGECGLRCEAPGAQLECRLGQCVVTGCQEGFHDIDGDPENGCEYACTFTSNDDTPDAGFIDANCDGTDGVPADAIFVAPSPVGDDGAAGTIEEPVATITRGIELAEADSSKQYLIVAEGVYAQRVEMRDGVSIFGGYRVEGRRWDRLAAVEAPSIIGAGNIGLSAQDISLPTVVGNFQIVGETSQSLGETTYGVRLVNVSDSFILRGNIIVAGDGAKGEDGREGPSGEEGGRGGDGEVGCDGCSERGTAGLSGASGCGSRGGVGGRGGHASGRGDAGAQGSGRAGGQGGAGGRADTSLCGFCGNNDSGVDGGRGGNGVPGDAGAGGAAEGSVVGGLWFGGKGADGAAGGDGSGGGGGGGGGGSNCCRDDRGGGGGGGGGGGCGGAGGVGAEGGGGSLGVFLFNASPQILNNEITTGNGGDGGEGLAGGLGGVGGSFGAAGGPADDGGPGGKGGNGGRGGQGGCGGGGAGGASFGILSEGASSAVSMANAVSHGTSGLGGPSCGNGGAGGLAGETN